MILISLIFLCQISLIPPEKSTPDQFPPAVTLGRYDLFQDKYWTIESETVQQLRSQGYNITGNANQHVQATYTYLGYTLRSKIVKLSWPNATLEITEGTHDLNLTVNKIMDNGTIGERLGSFLKSNLPQYIHPYPLTVEDPDIGVGFDPSAFTIGNTFNVSLLTYTVDRTETLDNTPWGENNTYVCVGYFANATHSYTWTTWCDARSGLFLKHVAESNTPTSISYEEQEIIETGIENDRFDVLQNGQSYQVFVHTNSTLTGFEFDSNADKVSLTIDGPSGTSGICNITIPKSLVPAGYGFEVHVDEQKVNHTLTEDANNYYVSTSYQHSTHTITVNIVGGTLWTQWWIWAIAITVIAILVVGTIYFSKKRHHGSHRSHRRTHS